MKAVNLTSAPPAPAQRFSLFKGGVTKTIPSKTITFQQLQELVTSNKYAAMTRALRALPLKSLKRKQLKLYSSRSDFFTPTGEFTTRNAAGLAVRSGMVGLDFDGVPNPAGLGKALRRDKVLGPSIQHYFISQSEKGLKVLMAVDSTVPHAVSYQAILKYLAKHRPQWFKWVDEACKDLPRGCLLCHDPNAFLNPDHATPIPFPIVADLADEFDDRRSPFPKASLPTDDTASAERWVAAVEAAGGLPDDHNRWIRFGFAFASLGEAGRSYFHRVSKTSSKYKEGLCDRKFDLLLKAYTGRSTIGTFIWLCQEAGIHLPAASQHTPCIPEAVFNQLPTLLRDCCNAFDAPRERDVMLLGGLAVLSGCFPGVGGTYNRRAHGLNLFVFIIAPAASGKGTLAWAHYLAQPWHRRMLADSQTARDLYDAQLAASKNKDNPVPPPVGPPPRQQLFLPANTTAAAMLTQLADNGGRGIICETEADTLSGALGADFGNFSDLLRKAFHHEPVSVLRKTDRQYIDLPRPSLSIALTGTPDQVARLLKTAEDGLVSRNLFYTFTQTPLWRDVGPQAGSSLDEHFAPLAAKVLKLIEAFPEPTEALPYPVQITFSAADWQRLNQAGAAGLSEAYDAAGGTGASTAYRLGLIAWRIAALLTVLRCYDNGEAPDGTIEAEPVDVTLALTIMDTVRAHALVVLASLSAKGLKSPSDFAIKAEKQAEARRLRAIPMSLQKIADRLEESKTTIARWVK